jgi:hypothetical protein
VECQKSKESITADNDLTYIQAELGGSAQRLYARLGFHTSAPNFVSGFIWDR